MSEINPFIIRDPRFRTSRFPGFQSQDLSTTGNVAPPTAAGPAQLSTPVPRPTALGSVFADDLDDEFGFDDTFAGAPGSAPAVADPAEASSFSGSGTISGGRVGTTGISNETIGRAAGAALSFANPALAVAARFGIPALLDAFDTNQGLDPETVSDLATGPNVSTEGFSVSQSGPGVVGGDFGVGVGFGGPAEPEASDPNEIGAAAQAAADAEAAGDFGAGADAGESGVGDQGGFGGAPGADDTSDDPDEGAGGGGDGGASGGGDGDDGGDDPERAGGPVLANQPGGEVRRVAHDGEFVLQTEIVHALGQDALNAINAGDFDPAAVRGALGLAPTPSASFPGALPAGAPFPEPSADLTGLPVVPADIPTGRPTTMVAGGPRSALGSIRA